MALFPQVPASITSSQPSKQPAVASATWLQSSLQGLEQKEDADISASSFAATTRSEEPTDTEEQVAPPNFPFRGLVQMVPEPAVEEDYKLGFGCTQIAFRRRTDVGPTSAHPSVRRWLPTLGQRLFDRRANFGPTSASQRQKLYSMYSISQSDMFTNNFFSANL